MTGSERYPNPFPRGLRLFHATPVVHLPGVLRRGLDPEMSGYLGVHVSETPRPSFVRWLHHAPVAVLRVDVEGLRWVPGGDDEGDLAVQDLIGPERLFVVSVETDHVTCQGRPGCRRRAIPTVGVCPRCWNAHNYGKG